MISIEKALQLVHEQAIALSATQVSPAEALGAYLAGPVFAPFDLPPFDRSTMDGYALCGEAATYSLAGAVETGGQHLPDLMPGTACRIFTGGQVPATATAVVKQEQTRLENGFLHLTAPVKAGENIIRRGSELRQGQEVLPAGHAVSAATVGLLVSLGLSQVSVFRKPGIGLLTSGNELVEAGQPLTGSQVYDSNSHSLAAALSRYGFACTGRLLLRDDPVAIREGIARLLGQADVLLVSGGISVGDHDYVKQALEENGVQEVFYKVWQRPGMPLYFGKKGHQFVFALPGNPASSLTCFYVYVLPLLQRLSGAQETGLMRLQVPVAHAFGHTAERPAFLKARLAGGQVRILDGQGSSVISSLAEANALVFLPGPVQLRAGDGVECVVF
jgi:molybdopterin molybdotransferase